MEFKRLGFRQCRSAVDGQVHSSLGMTSRDGLNGRYILLMKFPFALMNIDYNFRNNLSQMGIITYKYHITDSSSLPRVF